MREINGRGPRGLGGWLIVLCVLLLVWGPLTFAIAASSAWSAIAVRGAPVVAVLFIRLVATAFGVAAGVALMRLRGPGVAMAKAALLLLALTDLLVYATPYFPSNRPPGDTPIYLAIALTFDAGWLVYLFRSRRVKNSFQEARFEVPGTRNAEPL